MTKSRKRMLLSSIAMLLVALVALGSATYAWFTINKKVEANTMTVKAITTSGLQISNTKEDTWNRTVSFTGTTDLKPLSVPIATGAAMPAGFFATDVGTVNSGTKGGAWASSDDDVKVAANTEGLATVPSLENATDKKQGANSYMAVYKVKIRSSGDAIDKAVTASISCAKPATATKDGTKFAKAALVADQAAAAATGFSGITADNVVAFWSDGSSYKPVASQTGGVPTLVGTAITTATDSAVVLPSVASSSTTYGYTLYVWYEGNDPECDNDYQDALADFTLTFTLAD